MMAYRRALSTVVVVSTFVLGASFVPTLPTPIHATIIVKPRSDLRHHPSLFAQQTNENASQENGNLVLPSANAVAAILLPVVMACTIAFPAFAATATTGSFNFDSKLFSNDYEDPLHPFCRRHIQVSSVDGSHSFTYSGSSVDSPKDDPRLYGCSPKETKQFGRLQKDTFGGTITDNKITGIDKNGQTLQGVWEPAGSVAATTTKELGDVDGIRWSDGNKWIVKEKSLAMQAGEFLTFSYIGVSLLAGVNGLYQMYQKKTSETSSD